MKPIPKCLLSLTLSLALSVSLPLPAVRADTARRPAWAGRFYEAHPSELSRTSADLTRRAQKSRINIPANRRLRDLVLPHAGFIDSGWTAARNKEHSLEVILPFLQRYLGEFELVPVVVGKGDVIRLSTTLESIVDQDTLLVVSSDLSQQRRHGLRSVSGSGICRHCIFGRSIYG